MRPRKCDCEAKNISESAMAATTISKAKRAHLATVVDAQDGAKLSKVEPLDEMLVGWCRGLAEA